MIDTEWAREFAAAWIDAWNAHDLERILSHYADDFEMTSPLIIERMQEPTGRLQGKAQIRRYWQRSLSATPPLKFQLIDVLAGVHSVTLYYRSVAARKVVAETLLVDEHGKVVQGMSQWSVVGDEV